jgi:uncharacterized membrane protein YwaF
MRIVLTTLTIAFIYAIMATIISEARSTVRDVIYSVVMTFGFVIIPVFICVFVFYFLHNIYRWTNKQPSILTQMLTLWFIYNLTLVLINLPDFFRHKNIVEYMPYKSFQEYFVSNILEGFVTATIFAFAIPLLDKYYKDKAFKIAARQNHNRT